MADPKQLVSYPEHPTSYLVPQGYPQYADDETSLVDLGLNIVRHKTWLFAIFLFCTLRATLFAFTKPKVLIEYSKDDPRAYDIEVTSPADYCLSAIMNDSKGDGMTSKKVLTAFGTRPSDKLDINVWELVRLANRHPWVNNVQTGPGVGGRCIAIDPWFIVS